MHLVFFYIASSKLLYCHTEWYSNHCWNPLFSCTIISSRHLDVLCIILCSLLAQRNAFPHSQEHYTIPNYCQGSPALILLWLHHYPPNPLFPSRQNPGKDKHAFSLRLHSWDQGEGGSSVPCGEQGKHRDLTTEGMEWCEGPFAPTTAFASHLPTPWPDGRHLHSSLFHSC